MPHFKRRYRFSRKARFWIKVCVVCLLFLLAYIIFCVQVTPAVKSYMEYKAHSVAVNELNTAVGKALKSENVNYDKLMNYQKDANGQIIAVQANSSAINTLKYEITQAVLDGLSQLEDSNMKIPMGDIFGGPLFPGRGPNLILRFSPVEDADSSISSQFTAAGINQTKQDIYLTAKADITALLSANQVKVHVENKFLVAESVLVGTVPDQYFNMTGGTANDAITYGNFGTGSSSNSATRKK
ncbi:MAG TPA: sporulation protein YunB [Ruminococcaceae bacterium]|nr:sporulation protein YunB [Oscillospiraceae bacterium]